MKFSRKLSYEISKLQLLFEKPTEEFKQKVIKIAPGYPENYLENWHRDAHKWIKGKQDTSSGPGTNSLLGFLDAAKEMNYDINLIIHATKKWRKNTKREKAVEKWLFENNIINTCDIIYPDEIKGRNLFEGAKKQVIVNIFERDPKARQECINIYGYKCFICDFDFEQVYGKLGKNFIHVHHLKPLSEIDREYQVLPKEDLRPVCPNCHAMLHKKIPAYSIEDIRNLIAKK